MAGNNLNANLAFLQQYAANGGVIQMQNAAGQYVNATPQQLQQAGVLPKQGNQGNPQANPQQQQQPNAQLTAKQQQLLAARQQQLLAARQQQRAQVQAERDAQRQKQAQRNAAQRGLTSGVAGVSSQIGAMGDRLRAANEWAASVPTPGGILAMLIGLTALVSFVVPVNDGYTRAQLAWLTILGRTAIPEAQAVEDARDSGAISSQNGSIVDQVKNVVVNPIIGAIGGAVTGQGQKGQSGGAQQTATPAPTTQKPGWGQLPIPPPMSSTGVRTL